MKANQTLFVLATLVILSGCTGKSMEKTQKVTIDNKNYTLETARTEEEKSKGLGGRNSLDKNSGMIFLYDTPEYPQFWMKDTLFPLQILFVDGCTIVDIQDMTKEEDPANPQTIYKSREQADKAIELNSKSVTESVVGQKIKQLCN